MTLDDLVKIYTDTFWRGPKRDSDTADHAGIRAVIRAAAEWLDTQEGGWHVDASLRLLEQFDGEKEAVPGGSACHSAEHAMPETASNDERKV